MEKFCFEETVLCDLKVISPFYTEDRRGWFLKSFEQYLFECAGISFSPFETFYTKSAKGTVRGLHFQRRRSQDKLVQVLHGAVYDVAVDLRRDSLTFGRWEGFHLTAENRKLLYIPKGFAHGFLTLEDDTLFSYLCGDRYDPESDGGIRWDDPQIGVKWPVERVEQVILSEKDAALPPLSVFLKKYGALSGE